MGIQPSRLTYISRRMVHQKPLESNADKKFYSLNEAAQTTNDRPIGQYSWKAIAVDQLNVR